MSDSTNMCSKLWTADILTLVHVLILLFVGSCFAGAPVTTETINLASIKNTSQLIKTLITSEPEANIIVRPSSYMTSPEFASSSSVMHSSTPTSTISDRHEITTLTIKAPLANASSTPISEAALPLAETVVAATATMADESVTATAAAAKASTVAATATTATGVVSVAAASITDAGAVTMGAASTTTAGAVTVMKASSATVTLTTGSVTVTSAHAPARLQERLVALDCDLPLLPNESRLWRGNETHELNLPITMREECTTTSGGPEEECPPLVVSWEGAADIQSGDILIVRVRDARLVERARRTGDTRRVTRAGGDTALNHTGGHPDSQPCTPDDAAGHEHCDVTEGVLLDITPLAESDAMLVTLYEKDLTDSVISYVFTVARMHRAPPQPAVYQVTRQGHEHCDVTEGVLLDITPLAESDAKLVTLYDKDLTEGVNLLIVVSESWGSQCVRLKVTVKSDNCGDNQDCSGKGVCYSNVSMEGYECQCCPGFMGPHCEEQDACNPSPCTNRGICVDISQGHDGALYQCLCPYGFTGKTCAEEVDPCSSSPCLHGGRCAAVAGGGNESAWQCACAEGWAGARCERAAGGGGACTSEPCVHGICVEPPAADTQPDDVGYRCFCRPGFAGERCEYEYNECESSPCGNGGTCTDRVGGFACACGRGYTGPTCRLKVDLCSPNPCTSSRYCIDRGNSYACECPRGFTGIDCLLPAKAACDNNPCAHGGTCWSGVDSFYCACRPGYTGKLCEDDFILESVIVGDSEAIRLGERDGGGSGGASVREVRLPLALYHDRLHNVYIAAGTLGAAIAIVGVVVTACHCRVNKTYARFMSRVYRASDAGPPHHWLQDKRAPAHVPPAPAAPHAPLDTADMYYTLDFSDSQSSPLIQ